MRKAEEAKRTKRDTRYAAKLGPDAASKVQRAEALMEDRRQDGLTCRRALPKSGHAPGRDAVEDQVGHLTENTFQDFPRIQ